MNLDSFSSTVFDQLLNDHVKSILDRIRYQSGMRTWNCSGRIGLTDSESVLCFSKVVLDGVLGSRSWKAKAEE